MKNLVKKKLIAAGVAAVCGLGVTSGAYAASIENLLYSNTLFEDDNFESLVDNVGNNGLLDVGDSLRGIINIPRLVDKDGGGSTFLGAASGGVNNELAGVFDTTVVSKTFAFTDTNSLSVTFGQDFYNYVFGPTAGFGASIGQAGLAAGAMIAFFQDSTPEFTGSGCAAGAGGTCEGNITDGSLIWSVGFGGANELGEGANALGGFGDEAWAALGVEDLSVFSTFSSAQAVGSFNIFLSILDNPLGIEFNQSPTNVGPLGDGFIDVIGSGSLLGVNDLNTVYQASSDSDYTAQFVPEPTTMFLLGAGLLGLGFSGRGKKRSS